MNRLHFFGLVAVLGAVLCAAPTATAQCGGVCLYEVGTPDQALAGAGAGARAQDAGTVWFNPAGMTRLPGTEALLGAGVLIMDQSFDVSSKTVSPDANPQGGGQAGLVVPLAGAYLASDLAGIGNLDETAIGRNLRLGIAVNTPYGGGWNYNGNWAGRNYVTELASLLLNIQPSVAYRVTDWLSVGGGVNVYYFDAEEEFRLSTRPDARTAKVEDLDEWLVGGTVGLMVHLSNRTRLGLTYKTELNIDASGTLDNTQETIKVKFTMPQGVNVSLFHQLTPTVALLADAGWSDYSAFKYQRVRINRFRGKLDRDWQDTWRIGGGVQFQVTDATRLQGGVAYDSDPIRSASKRFPDIPIGDALRFALGGQHDFNKHVNMGLGYTLGWWINNDIDEVTLPDGVVLDGEYTPNLLHFVSAYLKLTF